MPSRVFLAVAGASGAVSVGIDAAATHLLAGDAERLAFAATAARYGVIHAAALLALALLIERANNFWLKAAGWCFVAGLAMFCGSLDLLAAGAPHGVAAAAPWGGTAFILGWLAVLVAALRPRRA
ncbi:MAG TPA: DUF423 domain-containing protein [Stellaceae bacterium]|jgi:uncharacterized membrane protein YgdD (TMEM256/DUF423 family)